MKVVVGLSGGVDSSVTALLLKQKGYDVIGLFMKNWDDEEDCNATVDQQDVANVADQIGIPFYTVNFAKEYWDNVFAECLEEYAKGYTPNPDILCNREIKFKLLFEKALSLGADYLATGHYARVLDDFQLGRGVDPDKDQSYFLYTLKSQILQKVLFPLGEMKKTEVRAIAKEYNLATATKKDSTGICFIGKKNFRPFLSKYIEKNPGNIETLDGKVVGRHEGIAYYTIGQRKGLQIGGEGEAWFIVDKDQQRNTLLAVQGDDHPALYAQALTATDISWVSQQPAFPFHCTAKIRYRAPDQKCKVEIINNKLYVFFETPQKAITPRQSIVFYQNNHCLGGAIIESKV